VAKSVSRFSPVDSLSAVRRRRLRVSYAMDLFLSSGVVLYAGVTFKFSPRVGGRDGLRIRERLRSKGRSKNTPVGTRRALFTVIKCPLPAWWRFSGKIAPRRRFSPLNFNRGRVFMGRSYTGTPASDQSHTIDHCADDNDRWSSEPAGSILLAFAALSSWTHHLWLR